MQKPKVAFICVHNSCRSQMAEAISKLLAFDVFEAYSAGTEKKDRINPDAVDAIMELYGMDMRNTQKPKFLEEILPVNIVVTMGCNAECPYLPCSYREDWGLEDPTGKEKSEFIKTARIIERKVLELKEKTKELFKENK